MELLRSRPVSRDEDDGEHATYECQACLHEATFSGVYNPSTYITCPMCGWDEEKDES